MDTSDLKTVIKSYRDALEAQKQASEANIENQRKLDYATIMSRANKAGMMYSNFPERSKIQYQTSTYLPALQNVYNTYQTGQQKLRENAIKYANQIKSLDDAIADLNAGSIVSSNAY